MLAIPPFSAICAIADFAISPASSLFSASFSASRFLAGAEGFEPPSPVLETGSLAVELTPLYLPATVPHRQTESIRLFHFLVRGVLAALPAELAELKTLGGRLAVLGR